MIIDSVIESFPGGAYQVVVIFCYRDATLHDCWQARGSATNYWRYCSDLTRRSCRLSGVCRQSLVHSAQSNLTLARFSILLCLPDFGEHVAPVCLVIIAFSYYIQYRLGPYISSFHRLFRKVSAVFNNISLNINHSFRDYTLLLICLTGVDEK